MIFKPSVENLVMANEFSKRTVLPGRISFSDGGKALYIDRASSQFQVILELGASSTVDLDWAESLKDLGFFDKKKSIKSQILREGCIKSKGSFSIGKIASVLFFFGQSDAMLKSLLDSNPLGKDLLRYYAENVSKKSATAIFMEALEPILPEIQANVTRAFPSLMFKAFYSPTSSTNLTAMMRFKSLTETVQIYFFSLISDGKPTFYLERLIGFEDPNKIVELGKALALGGANHDFLMFNPLNR